MAREALGEFEQLVLLAVLRLGDGAYGVPIIDEIRTRAGRRASRAAVYIALQRLRDKGFVSSTVADPTPERGGRAKRYYRVEPAAMRLLADSRQALISMWSGIEPLLEQQ